MQATVPFEILLFENNYFSRGVNFAIQDNKIYDNYNVIYGPITDVFCLTGVEENKTLSLK